MGWLWNSSSSEKAPAPQADKETAPPPPTSTPAASNSATSNTSSDPELEKFLELLNTKSEPSDSATADSSSSSQKPSDQSSLSSWLSVGTSRTASKPTVEAPLGSDLSESLLPADMSCRQAFDQAWACNSMGGQWNAVYRYGEMRSCSEHWDDFWFCMRTRSHAPEMREKLIRAHYRNKEYAKYGPGKPNSEDIWQSREEKVEEGTVFTEPIE